jgi:hypothetical protein
VSEPWGRGVHEDLRARLVHFRIRDVHIPDPAALLAALYGSDLLQGKVIDLSGERAGDDSFAVVSVEGLTKPVVVPVRCILGVQ